jgi:hypothetical protein
MKTAVNIPWNAVEPGGPPFPDKRLPLLVSESLRLDVTGGRASVRAAVPEGNSHAQPDSVVALVAHLEEALRAPAMAILTRSTFSSLLELPVPTLGITAILTSDNETTVILQSAATSPASRLFPNPEHRRDAAARTYIARYARLDSDARAFVPDDREHDEEETPHISPRFEFLRPTSWGFTPTINSMHWTATNLFHTPTSPKFPPKSHHATRPRFEDPFAEPAADRGDPFQCIPQLKQFIAFCETQPAHAAVSNAFYALALNIGRCRLFGVTVHDPAADVSLSTISFDRASLHLIDHLKDVMRWLEEIQTQPEGYRGYEERNVALELLESRMDAHAAYLALDEAYAAARFNGEVEADAMGRRLNQVRRLIDRLDGNLQNQLPLLRLAASTRLLENWRRLLAPAYRDCPPWWLDGCLDETQLP